MQSAEQQILSFVKVLVNDPDQVRVKSTAGNPVVVEIRACRDDLAELQAKEHAIRTICSSASGLRKEQFLLKFLECGCIEPFARA
jgi:predicted RNA-binding protein YlqC (UPF0109 family)